MKTLIRAFTVVLVLIFLKGIASGKHVEHNSQEVFITRLTFGNGSTQSIMILLKGSPNAGIGCNPTKDITW